MYNIAQTQKGNNHMTMNQTHKKSQTHVGHTERAYRTDNEHRQRQRMQTLATTVHPRSGENLNLTALLTEITLLMLY